MNRKIAAAIVGIMIAVCGCSAAGDQAGAAGTQQIQAETEQNETKGEQTQASDQTHSRIAYRYAGREEGQKLMLSNDAYYQGFSQNDLDFKMQKKNATMEEYQSFAIEQVEDFTPEEIAAIDEIFVWMEKTLEENGYTLPPLDEIVLIKTTMKEECDAGAYTHGTQIYLSENMIKDYVSGKDKMFVREIFWHETFHCLTRCNPDFRAEMYKLIHFTVQDKDFPLPASVAEYHISNPDVEHHNSYATFIINGQNIDCFTDYVTTRHFEKKGDSFFYCSTTALVPIDGSDIYYTPEQAENFDEIFGTNTDYVIDPEECMADNFSYALTYGMSGPDGKGYPNPEIIEGILEILSK